MKNEICVAGSQPLLDEQSGYPWWITPTAIRSVMKRCPDWLSDTARYEFEHLNTGPAAMELKRLASLAAVVDNIVNDTAFMAFVIDRYGRTDKHQYRIINGPSGDRCVFVCCKNEQSGQMVMITVLYYDSERVRMGLLPSRHLAVAGNVPRRDR